VSKKEKKQMKIFIFFNMYGMLFRFAEEPFKEQFLNVIYLLIFSRLSHLLYVVLQLKRKTV